MLGRRFTHVLAAVVGAGNSIIPMFPAAMLQIPLVDAAGAPRAVPLLTQTSLADLPISPVVLSAGEATTISFTAASVAVAGPTLMALIESGIFPGFAAVAMWAMDGATMRAHAMPGTLSRAQAVGRAIREARTSGGDPVDAACRLLGGVVLFTGGILTASTSDSGVTTTSLSSGSSQLTIYSLNDENLIAWDNTHDTPLAIAPDLVCYLTTDGQPFSNATADIERFATGKQVAVIGVPAAAVGFASPAIVAAFSGVLASLGYSGPYVPIGRAS
jgi:DUF917 family protein